MSEFPITPIIREPYEPVVDEIIEARSDFRKLVSVHLDGEFVGRALNGPMSSVNEAIDERYYQQMVDYTRAQGIATPERDALWAMSYASAATNYLFTTYEKEQRTHLDDISLARATELGRVGDVMAFQQRRTRIAPGVLSVPTELVERTHDGGCTSTAFAMLARELTGDPIEATDIEFDNRSRYGKSHVKFASHQLLPVLCNSDFTARYGQHCEAIVLNGFDFNSLANLVNGLKERLPGAQIFCSLNVRSTGHVSRVLHSVFLESIEEGRVRLVHPESKFLRSNLYYLGDFGNRWQVGKNHGYILIAEDVATDEAASC